jgi:hypothetical protein
MDRERKKYLKNARCPIPGGAAKRRAGVMKFGAPNGYPTMVGTLRFSRLRGPESKSCSHSPANGRIRWFEWLDPEFATGTIVCCNNLA